MIDTAKRRELEIDLDRSARYHLLRGSHFQSRHRWTMFFVLVAGSTAALTLFELLEPVWMWIGWDSKVVATGASSIAAIAGFAELAFAYSAKATEHKKLESKYRSLYARVSVLSEDRDEEFNRLYTEAHSIEMPEPIHHAVDAISHNQVMKSKNLPTVSVGWRQFFAHVFTFRNHEFK